MEIDLRPIFRRSFNRAVLQACSFSWFSITTTSRKNLPIISEIPFRIVGSPPGRRIFVTPHWTKRLERRIISSFVRICSAGESSTPSLGIQYKPTNIWLFYFVGDKDKAYIADCTSQLEIFEDNRVYD